MLLPDKMTRYEESVLSKFVPLMQVLSKEKTIKVKELYEKTSEKFSTVCEFIQTLDALYALNKIDLNESAGEIICL